MSARAEAEEGAGDDGDGDVGGKGLSGGERGERAEPLEGGGAEAFAGERQCW
jgi:hypothetical protein